MAIFDRLTRTEIQTRYTNKGWYLFCPIYFSLDGDNADLVERNWIPVWLLDIAEGIQMTMNYILTAAFPDSYEPTWMLYDTGPIERTLGS